MSSPCSIKYGRFSPQKRLRPATIPSWPPSPHPSAVPLQFGHVPIYLLSDGQCYMWPEKRAWKTYVRGKDKEAHPDTMST